MTPNDILIIVIGLFFAVTGLMYVFHLRQKEEKTKREKMVSYSLIGIGIVVTCLPFRHILLNGLPKESPKRSELMGQEAFGPPPPASSGSFEDASALYAKGARLWNMDLNGFDSTEAAMDYFNRSIEAYETAEALSARGQLKVQLSMMREAMTDYNRAIELKPEYGNAYFNRAALYYIFGDVPSACPDWQKAAELGVAGSEDLLRTMCH